MAPDTTSMKAYIYHAIRRDFEKNLTLATRPVPTVPSSVSSKPSILVKVSSTSLNPADYKVPEDRLIGRLIIQLPATPGLDFAGHVVEIPTQGIDKFPHLKDLKAGDRVVGRFDWLYQHGSLAEYTLAQPTALVRLPEQLTLAQGAALGTGAITAYQSLEGHVKAGDRVFINGGSGGVGTFTIQIAKLLGASYVAVTCSSSNAALCKELGADTVLDYHSVDVPKELAAISKRDGKPFDHIVDNVGDITNHFEKSPDYLKPSGTYLQVSATGDNFAGIWSMLTRALRPVWLGGVNRRWKSLLVKNNPEHLQKIVKWASAGQLRIIIDSEYEFEDARQAFVKLKTGRAKGKIVVHVNHNRD
jgi:NADPH:quinone reductase-like Zn-dependent oxidoreductase